MDATIVEQARARAASLVEALKRHASGKKLTRDQQELIESCASSKQRGIAYTLNAWATAICEEPRTLEKQFLAAGIRLEKFQLITIRELLAAKSRDEHLQRVRILKADAERKEQENRVTDGQLVDKDRAERWLAVLFAELRAHLDSASDDASRRFGAEACRIVENRLKA